MDFNFQIGMLPRAGSAWFATLLNMHPGIFCFHDALQSYKGLYLEAPASKWRYQNVGDSSSYCCARPRVARSVYIERDAAECFESLDELNLAENFHTICHMAEEWKNQGPSFKFEDVFTKDIEKSVDTLAHIFHILVPGTTLNEDLVRFLLPLKVELLENGPESFDIEEIKRRLP